MVVRGYVQSGEKFESSSTHIPSLGQTKWPAHLRSHEVT